MKSIPERIAFIGLIPFMIILGLGIILIAFLLVFQLPVQPLQRVEPGLADYRSEIVFLIQPLEEDVINQALQDAENSNRQEEVTRPVERPSFTPTPTQTFAPSLTFTHTPAPTSTPSHTPLPTLTNTDPPAIQPTRTQKPTQKMTEKPTDAPTQKPTDPPPTAVPPSPTPKPTNPPPTITLLPIPKSTATPPPNPYP